MIWQTVFRRTDANVMPGLDGLRAISILCVIFAHLLWTPSFPLKALAKVLNPGGLGVRTFFVISGFLITTILLREKETTGTISLPNFYFRRALRIFPAYYTYLAGVFLLALAHVIKLEPSDYFYTLTYTFNLKGQQDTWWVGHTWSLAVEEQFYLLWPLVVRKFSTQTLQRIALLCVCLAPAGRAMLCVVAPPIANRWYLALPFVADPIAIGTLLAIFFRKAYWKRWLAGSVRRRWFWLIPVIILSIESLDHRSRFFPHPVMLTAVLQPLANLGLALVVARAVLVSDDLAGWVLNCRMLVAIGVLSYSLYLWQMLFLSSVSSAWLTFPLDLLWVAVAAVLSFVLVEHPLNEMRKKIRLPATLIPVHAVSVEA